MMKKKERIELKEKLKENFIKDFNFENLSDGDKQFFIKTMFNTIINCDIYEEAIGSEDVIIYNTAAANFQNFHILKALKDNNEKLDTLIELLSKDKV